MGSTVNADTGYRKYVCLKVLALIILRENIVCRAQEGVQRNWIICRMLWQ